LEVRVRGAALGWVCFAALVVTLGLEYRMGRVRLAEVNAPRSVDLVLQADPADVAILEWPTYTPGVDGEAMFRSLYHGKRVVNGFSGFGLSSLRDLSGLLTIGGRPFPSAEAQAALRQIYPLRYLVVHVESVPRLRTSWLAARRSPPPTLGFHGSYDGVDLYDVIAEPDRGTRLERDVSGSFLLRHPDLELEVASLVPPPAGGPEPFVDVRLNGHAVARVALDEKGAVLRTHLTGDVYRAAPNAFTLDYGYSWPLAHLGPRHRIGRTDVLSPGDLAVLSDGGPSRPPGSRIAFNGVDLSPNRRGYNLLALQADGRTLGTAAFDTAAEVDASAGLAAWIGALPAGAIVAGAVRDEASTRLGADGVAVLRSLGVGADLRGRFRWAHAFVGVKGAAPGTAAESLGAEEAELEIGHPPRDQGFILRRFALGS
jgi:hypothetical protein